jgi:hypothetical protein
VPDERGSDTGSATPGIGGEHPEFSDTFAHEAESHPFRWGYVSQFQPFHDVRAQSDNGDPK